MHKTIGDQPLTYPEVKYINESAVQSLLMEDTVSYLDYLETRIRAIALRKSLAWVKPKVIYDDPVHPDEGDIRSMTCFTDIVKVVKIISTNPIRQKHWSVSVGATLMLDYDENHPVAIFDATMMSSIRTSAIAILGARFAGSDIKEPLLIGYGRVGSFAAEIFTKLGSQPRVYDINLPPQTRDAISIETNLEHFEAATIITATTSRKPFLTPENTHADLIISLGADTAFNFELHTGLIEQRGGLFVDCPDAAHVGDLSQLEDAIKLIQGDVLDLYRAGKNAKTIISVGSPLMDALTIEYMAKKLNLL